ncbi:citramalate synthase [Desulfoluna spongiiphila]|uniref:Citramalate synthase n=1 Tax=Desulfoluna spongiiphila TaxID=419481 RepID=A0A1G5JJ40_9BACT|nr:citramalate synthase [Desulfoluna spongiiphila]SCY87779.1 2-isopropylmalate synthase [Desulfoluna spongiiphila]
MEPVLIFDTTLRDGAQGENISFSPEDKIKVAQRLDDMGIHYIEGGWPGSNPAADRFFELARSTEFVTARITAFGSTRRQGIPAEEDANLKALVACGSPAITIFGKTWDLHVVDIMGNTLSENLAMIEESVAFLKGHGREVLYDAEHFFDGYRANPEYAVKTLSAALSGGADIIVLCDTNGGTLPHEVTEILETVKAALDAETGRDIRMGIHAHNDCSVAVANSIAAVQAGAIMVQGTINGYGERCGNTDLTSVIPILNLKLKRPCVSAENLKKLKPLSRFVSETSNMIPLASRPFVGKSAFAHKGGVHVSAVMKEPLSYEHIDPEDVGNRRRVLVSDQAGRSNIEYKAKEMGIDLDAPEFDSKRIVNEIKMLEQEGYQYEVADGSFKVLMDKFLLQYEPVFDLESFRVTIEKDKDRPCTSHAIVKVNVGGVSEITAAEGHGPVSALDNALRKALSRFYKELETMHLVDFKVRVMDGRGGTEAKVRVLIESRDGDDIWSTIGVSEDIIEASFEALADSFQYKLAKKK